MDHETLIKLGTYTMPYGRYEGWFLADLPERYLIWYSHAGHEPSELGRLLGLMLELKTNGLEGLLRPLRPADYERPPMRPRSAER